MPSPSCSRIVPGSCSTGWSGVRTRLRNRAEARYDSASASSAIGAVRTWMSTPAIAGPPTADTDRLALSIAFPSTSCSRRTTAVTSVSQARSKNTATVPTTKVRTNRSSMLRTFEHERERHERDHAGTDEVGDDHQAAPPRDAIQPDAGRQREQEVRQEPDRREQAHLRRVGVENEDGDDRQREERDLVAEDGDRLPEPEVPEVVLAQQRRRKPRGRGGRAASVRSSRAAVAQRRDLG